jgi:hypothetical protein
VDIEEFNLTVVENSGICKFSRIYLSNLKLKKSYLKLFLLAHTLEQFLSIYVKFVFILQILTPFYFQFLFFTIKLKKE